MMKSGQNLNHPRPGARILVELLRREKDITAIKQLLSDEPRDLHQSDFICQSSEIAFQSIVLPSFFVHTFQNSGSLE